MMERNLSLAPQLELRARSNFISFFVLLYINTSDIFCNDSYVKIL